MSVAEVIKELDKMTDDQIREVEALLRRRRVESARRTAIHGGIRPGFEKTVDRVFSTHEALLRKLAQ